MQTVSVPVEGESPAQPGFYLYNIDNGYYRFDDDGKQVDIPAIVYPGTDLNARCPATIPSTYTYKPEGPADLDLSPYMASSFKDKNNNTYTRAEILNYKLSKITYDPDRANTGTNTYFGFDLDGYGNPKITSNTHADVRFTIGGKDYPPEIYESFPEKTYRPNGCEKMRSIYKIWMDLTWSATVEEKKEIDLSKNSTVKVGGTVQLKAQIRTKPFRQQKFDAWADVTQRSDMEWTTNNSGVVEILPGGKVKGLKASTANVRITWKKDVVIDSDPKKAQTYWLTDAITITVTDQPPVGGGGGCLAPSPGATIDADYMEPNPTGAIRADNRGSEKFDVLQGIPTSESLYAQVKANNYLAKHTFSEMSGECNYDVNVKKTYTLEWTETAEDRIETPMSELQEVTQVVTVKRPYSYWQIDNFEAYAIKEAEMANYALPENGRVYLTPNGYYPPTVDISASDSLSEHIIEPKYEDVILPPETISGETKPTIPYSIRRYQKATPYLNREFTC